MVEPLPSKQITRVRFPSSAPKGRHSGYKGFRYGQDLSRVAFSLFCGGFGVLKPDAWCRGGASDGAIGASEGRLRGSLGASRQKASKGSAPRQKVRPRAPTDQPENGKVPRKARRPSLKNRVMLDLDQACAEVVLHPCWVMVCISYILYVTITRLSK